MFDRSGHKGNELQISNNEFLETWKELIQDSRRTGVRLRLNAVSALVFSLTLFFIAPVQIYLNNIDEFWFRLDLFGWQTLLVATGVFIVLFLFGIVTRGKILDLYVSVLIGLTLVVYLQGNFLNISYGRMSGEKIAWEKYGTYAIFNTLICTIILHIPSVLRVFSRRIWERFIVFISVLLIGMQIVGIIGLYIPYREKQKDSIIYALNWEGVSDYSTQENLILIIVDSYDQLYFQEFLAAHPETRDYFDGFTEYRNTAGISSTTVFSMTPMLTGKTFKWEEESYSDYLRDAWDQEELFKRLKAADYDIRALTSVSQHFCYIDQNAVSLFENVVKADTVIQDYNSFLNLLYSLTMYTYLPHVLKPGFWLYPGEFNYLQKRTYYTEFDPYFYEDIQKYPVKPVSEKKTFRLYHLLSMHQPHLLTSSAEGSLEEVSSLESEEGTFTILSCMLDQMKEAGVYDSSTIVIAADHMSKLNLSDEDNPFCNVSAPLLLYKEKNAHGKMRTTTAPASLYDIQATMLEQAGLEYEDRGMPLNCLSEDTERERFFYRHTPNSFIFYEMVIGSEDANNIKNYRFTGNIYEPRDKSKVNETPVAD